MTNRILLALMLAAFLSCAVAAAPKAKMSKSPKAKPAPNRIAGNDFINGINLPWFDGQFGHDLAPEPQNPEWGVWWKPEKVSSYFKDINQMGFKVVRVWLMERCEGWQVDQDGFIIGLDNTFLEHLDDLVRRAEAENLKLYLCLIGGWIEIKNYPSPLLNERQLKAYIDKAVKPIAQRFKGNRTIFAFDVINEIESETREGARHKATVAQAQNFIRKCAAAIKSVDRTRLVSAGSGYSGWRVVQDGYYKGLGLDFYDVHVYGDEGFLPDVKELNVDKPVLVGECGQMTQGDNDELQRKAVTAFYRNARDKGYAGCFVWEYGPYSKTHPIVRRDGSHRPVVADLEKIIKGRSTPTAQSKPTSPKDLLKRLAGTKWTNTNNVTFEWTKDGRFLHNGVERECRRLNAQRVQIVFSPDHVDTLEFDDKLTHFKQLIRGGPDTFQGRRAQ